MASRTEKKIQRVAVKGPGGSKRKGPIQEEKDYYAKMRNLKAKARADEQKARTKADTKSRAKAMRAHQKGKEWEVKNLTADERIGLSDIMGSPTRYTAPESRLFASVGKQDVGD